MRPESYTQSALPFLSAKEAAQGAGRFPGRFRIVHIASEGIADRAADIGNEDGVGGRALDAERDAIGRLTKRRDPRRLASE